MVAKALRPRKRVSKGTSFHRGPVLVAVDQGSGSSRVIAFDHDGRIIAAARRPLVTRTPQPGWVEHDPHQLLQGVRSALAVVLAELGTRPAVIGLTTQRSTLIMWERDTGRPVSPAISWQDRRAADRCEAMARDAAHIHRTTGLMLSPHYAAPKLGWLLDRLPGGRRRAERGEWLCGTLNSFLLWQLSGRHLHITDHTQAARMLLMDLGTLEWDAGLCDRFGIPRCMLPTIAPTVADYGEISIGSRGAPVLASIGDQQAALIGQGTSTSGDLGLHYGTGVFVLRPTGGRVVRRPGLLSSVAWSHGSQRSYLLEGGVNAVGSGLSWLQRHWRVPADLDALDRLAGRSTHPAVVLPALAGLAAPDWDPAAGGMVAGLTLATEPADLVWGFLNGVAYLVDRIVDAMPVASRGMAAASGGLSSLDSLIQCQADLGGWAIRRTAERDTSAWGAAILAGVGAGVWRAPSDAVAETAYDRVFRPHGRRSDWKGRIRAWEELIRSARELGAIAASTSRHGRHVPSPRQKKRLEGVG